MKKYGAGEIREFLRALDLNILALIERHFDSERVEQAERRIRRAPRRR